MVRHHDKKGYRSPRQSDTEARWLNNSVAFPKEKAGGEMFKMMNTRKKKFCPEQSLHFLYVVLSLQTAPSASIVPPINKEFREAGMVIF